MIERVDVGTTEFVARRIIYRIPETELQGKFSMPYVIARAVIDGALTPDTFLDEAIRDSAVLALAEKVHMEVDPEFKASARTGQPCKMTIHLKDGRSLFRRVDYPKGTPESPFGPGEFRGKFTSCAHRVLTEQATDELAKLLDNLESVENIASVGELLMGAPRSS
jgi:2-methylcitrate dehydratase PrpD